MPVSSQVTNQQLTSQRPNTSKVWKVVYCYVNKAQAQFYSNWCMQSMCYNTAYKKKKKKNSSYRSILWQDETNIDVTLRMSTDEVSAVQKGNTIADIASKQSLSTKN